MVGAADELLDRCQDLDQLSCIMRDTAGSSGKYCVVSAPPWYGKTAVMAELALDPPLGVDVVSFFVRAATRRNRSDNLLESRVCTGCG